MKITVMTKRKRQKMMDSAMMSHNAIANVSDTLHPHSLGRVNRAILDSLEKIDAINDEPIVKISAFGCVLSISHDSKALPGGEK